MWYQDPSMSSTPVLLMGFNRPEHIRNVMLKFIELGVRNLFVSLDGPRDPSDKINCIKTYEEVERLKNNFNLKIIHRQNNLGCCLGVVSALDWFYSQVDFGVIFEDDCMPTDDTFKFFQEFQSKTTVYNNLGISIASAHNPFGSLPDNTPTKHVFIHGWATSADVWHLIRTDFFKITRPYTKNKIGEKRTRPEAIFWWASATRGRLGKVDTWDGMFYDRVWKLGIKTLLPSNNLIQNIGFGRDSTHTFVERKLTRQAPSIRLLAQNTDQYLQKYYFGIKSYHLLTPIFKILLDLIKVRKKIEFEDKLAQDRSQRVELN